MGFELVRKRTVPVPTWRGILLIGIIVALSAFAASKTLHAFLSVTHRVSANVLVVEGWLSDENLHTALSEFNQGKYELLVTTGGPLPKGKYLSGCEDYAELSTQTLRKLGMTQSQLLTATSPGGAKHRTYRSAAAAKDKLASRRLPLKGINILSSAVHTRRTGLVFQKVFGPSIPVGTIALAPEDYDPERWWTSSEGVKVVFSELLGWGYEYFLGSLRG